MIDLVRDLRYMAKEVDIPDAYELTTIEVRLPIVNDQIERLVNNLVLNDFTISVPPPRPGPQAQARASRLETALKALYKRLEQESGQNLFHNDVDGAVEAGEGVLKLLLRPDRWNMPVRDKDESDEDYLGRTIEAKRGSKLPLVLRTTDRRTYYPVKDEDGLAQVVEVSKRRVVDLQREFGKAEVTAALARSNLSFVGAPIDEFSSWSVGREVNLIEYWDREWACYVITDGLAEGHTRTGGLLKRFQHGYGRVPYFPAASSETSSTDPNKAALSSAFPIMYIVPFMNSLFTIWSNIIHLTGFPIVTRESPLAAIEGQTDEDSDEDPREELDIQPGKVLSGPPGTKFDILNFGPLSTALTGMVEKVEDIIQSAMLPSSMQGIPPGTRTSGYAIQELAAAAKSKYQTAVKNLERQLSEVLAFALYLVDTKIRQPVELLADLYDERRGVNYRDYVTLEPSDIHGYYNVEVKIQPRNPGDRIQEGTFLANMHAAGLIPKRLVVEEGLGIEQPDEIEDERLVEEWLQSPEVAQFIQQKALQKAGLDTMQEEIAAVQQLATQQMLAMNAAAGQAVPVMGGAAPGANGMAGGQSSPGVPSVTAPTSPGMEVPGALAGGIPGMGMGQQQPQATAQLPRQYRAKAGPKPGNPQAPSASPPIEGFRGR